MAWNVDTIKKTWSKKRLLLFYIRQLETMPGVTGKEEINLQEILGILKKLIPFAV